MAVTGAISPKKYANAITRHKIEERINFALIHARLYLSELYDEQDEKSAAANTFDISCGGWRI